MASRLKSRRAWVATAGEWCEVTPVRTPDENPRRGREALLAAVSGAVGGAGGGLLVPGVMGFLGPQAAGLGGILCFGLVGVLAGCVAAPLCVRGGTVEASLPRPESVLRSLFVGGLAGLFATLPIAMLLRALLLQGVNAIGRS